MKQIIGLGLLLLVTACQQPQSIEAASSRSQPLFFPRVAPNQGTLRQIWCRKPCLHLIALGYLIKHRPCRNVPAPSHQLTRWSRTLYINARNRFSELGHSWLSCAVDASDRHRNTLSTLTSAFPLPLANLECRHAVTFPHLH